jgi:CHAT domain-containing protein/Tfp pilus assembly protein PilF
VNEPANNMNKDQTSRVGWDLVESATACVRNNNVSGAIGVLGQAVREFRLCADSHGECHSLYMLAVAHNDIGNYEQSVRFHERGLEIARTLNKAYALLVEHLDGLGTSHGNMGKWQQAVQYLEQALEETRKPIVGLRERRARVLQHLANVYARYTNKYAEAIRLYDEAIAISKDCQDRYNIAACLSFKGQAMHASGNTEMGIEFYEQAKEIAEAEEYEQLLAACYAHLAAGYFHLGQTPLSKKYCEQALKLDQKYGNKQGLSRDYFILGQLVIEEDEDAALEAYRQSFLLARSIKDVKNALSALDGLGRIYQRRLQAHLARGYYDEALALCREIGDKRYEIQLTLSLATFGDEPELFETLERALVDAKQGGFIDLELDIEAGLAQLYDQHGDYEAARIHYQRSVALLERMRSSLRVEEHVRAFSESNAEVYDRLVDLCLLLGRETEAFKYSELARARVLNNLRHRRKAGPTNKLEGQQLAQYRRVCDEIISLDLSVQRLQLNGLAVPAEMEESLKRALVEEAELVLSVKRSASESYALDNFDVVDLGELQARLSAFEDNILVLAYYTTDKNSYIFVIGKDSLDVALLGMNSTALRELVQAFRTGLGIKEISTRDLGLVPEEQWQHQIRATSESYLPPSQRLYDVLIHKVESKLRAADHLCVIPHGPLHFMPFHALHDGRQFLIEQIPVSYAPSATTLSESLAKQFIPVGKVLALGDPRSELQPLRFARQEVETIEGLLGTQRCLQVSGRGATRDLIMKAGSGAADIDSFDCWHLAMHGVFIRAAPHLSYLQLASDEEEKGRVFAFEIAGMERVGRLSVLSACQTAMTREARGDELSGLLFSFMAAGAQAVVASLWSVADESTGALMQGFYKHLTSSDQLSLATALQRALLALLSAPATASPYYWAPFVLHGNWNPMPEPAAKPLAKLLPKPAQMLSEALTRAEILLREGESHLARGQLVSEKKSWSLLPDEERTELNQAIEAFSQALELAPDWPLAYRQRGIAYHNLLKGEEAAADLKRASDLNPRDALALACLGLILAERGKERELALELLERAFSLDSKIQLRYRRANTKRFERALERLRAEKTVEEISMPTPSDAGVFVERGSAYWQLSYTSGDHEENKKKAIEDFRRALELDSQCALAAVRLTWIEYSNHKPGAIEAYARIIDMNPKCAEAHLRLAGACKSHHEVERAVAEYNTALACDPSIEHAYCGLGETYLELAEWTSALEAFETERSINPNCFNAHLYLKELYRAVDRYEEAKTEYQECLRTTEHALYEGKLGVDLSDEVMNWIRKLAGRRQSESPQTLMLPMRVQMTELQRYLSRGNELTRAGQIQQAIAVYSELIERDPSYALVYAYRGGCYGAVKEHEKAFEDFRKAIEFDPDCAEAYFNLYVLCNNRGELDKAQHYLDRAIVLDPELAKRFREERNEEQGQKGSSSFSTFDLRRDLEESYRTSGIKCRWCDKPLRMPLGRLVVTSGADEMDELLKGIPYYCASCRTTSCFECCAESRLVEILCRSCGGQMKSWGLVDGNK